MELIIPDLIGAPDNIGALSTTRRGGHSRVPYDDGAGGGGLNLGIHVGDNPDAVRSNRALLKAVLPSEPVWLTQVHGARVIDAALQGGVQEADASISTKPGVVCAIQTADCLPVLFCDSGGRVVGAAHAGWRGLAGGVIQETVAAMRASGASDILAWLGPAIGPQCFEVGQDVLEVFVARDPEASRAFQSVAGVPGKYLADIYALAKATLHRAGVQRVSGGDFCTVMDSNRFYSFRRDKVTGRMASLIWLK